MDEIILLLCFPHRFSLLGCFLIIGVIFAYLVCFWLCLCVEGTSWTEVIADTEMAMVHKRFQKM